MSKSIASSIFGSALLVTLLASAASAGVQRTFVSGSGNDANPCSRVAPCRTFAQAISQANPAGEVYVLDSAGYGAFTINKAVSIVAPTGVIAGISVFSGDGIDITAGGNDTVVLRGLTVNNQGSTGIGVFFTNGSKLHLEACVINGFSNGSGNGFGLAVGGGAQVEVIDSIMRGNDVGILVQPFSGTAVATIDHVRLEANRAGLIARENAQVTVTNSVAANNGNGLLAESQTSGSVQMNVESTVLSGNGDGIDAEALGTGAVQVNVARCVISSNGSNGILAQLATVRLSSSTVTGNGVGLNNFFQGLILSRGDNTVEGNGVNTIGNIGSYAAK